VTETSECSTHDVGEVLTAQHRNVSELFSGVLGADGGVRARMFAKLLHALALHESAEHVVIHPEARKAIDGGDALVDALMSEEVSIRYALVELESVPVETDDFVVRLVQIRDLVVEHNRHEENDEFPLLMEQLDVADRRRLTRAVEALSKLAATGTEAEYSHADVAPGSPNMMVGPFAALLDRARRIIAQSSEAGA
jgi:hypothetical protein